MTRILVSTVRGASAPRHLPASGEDAPASCATDTAISYAPEALPPALPAEEGVAARDFATKAAHHKEKAAGEAA